ncbi:MAG: hypothetical protein WCV62_01765 [Candidatus Peribacteraceae bacterium]|jgi:hypothetical protein
MAEAPMENPSPLEHSPQEHRTDTESNADVTAGSREAVQVQREQQRNVVIENTRTGESKIAAEVERDRPKTQPLQPPSLPENQEAPPEQAQEGEKRESPAEADSMKAKAEQILDTAGQSAAKGWEKTADIATNGLTTVIAWFGKIWEKISGFIRGIPQNSKKSLATLLTFMGQKEWADRLLALPAGMTEKDQKELAGIRARMNPGKLKEEGDPAKDLAMLEKLRANHAALLRQHPLLRSRYPEGTEGGFLGYADEVVRQTLKPESGKEYTLAQVIEASGTFNGDAAARTAEAAQEQEARAVAQPTQAPPAAAPAAAAPPPTQQPAA